MSESKLPGGTFNLASGFDVTRMGYGAMQLAGPGVFGPPKDRDEAVAVLRDVVDLGITHIDTSDYYGPFVTNEIIKEALHPYPESLHIVTKVGARRDAEGGWPHAARRTTCVKRCARTWTGWVRGAGRGQSSSRWIRRSRDRVRSPGTLRRPR